MKIKNTSTRLFVINVFGKKYQVIPGIDASTEIPDEAAEDTFVKFLIETNQVVVTEHPSGDTEAAKRGRKPKDESDK